MRRAELEALALGLLHGPAELVPVSSSGHAAALPWLLAWEVAGWDGARRKQLQVALHAGTAAALLIVLRPTHVRPRFLAAAVLPPALAGLALERRIEERLGTPAMLAAGLLAGGGALVLADRSHATRGRDDAGVRDGLALGLAQAAALVPGVSRSGATLAAARARGFSRPDASRLSWEVALPVLAGASGLKAWRASQRRPDPSWDMRPLALGAGAAFASTLECARAIGIERRAPLWPWAAWRAGLAATILAVRHNRAR
ncbi:MAG TPA: undecaprenyl-diphosphate phosphatase [Solirubrobacteraceae bacterium]|nr:undecaprenyl-diphosphate phosphatase [Solirubrobacteraceae bacterium]